jgi:hypothetical protein
MLRKPGIVAFRSQVATHAFDYSETVPNHERFTR